MTKSLTHNEYSSLYGPTEGDKLRLADTELIAEIEEDYTSYGEEAVFGGGKTIRDGLAQAPEVTSDDGSLDWVITNATIIDPIAGIIKADIGIKEGKIVGVGNAGNPNAMAGVDEDLVIGSNTEPFDASGYIVTPGALDIHVHFWGANLPETALKSGITTMLGGGTGASTLPIATSGGWNIKMMMKAAQEWPINFGFWGKGSISNPKGIIDQIEAGAAGLKIHEDWGAMPAVIDTCLDVCDDYDVQCILHTDTLNESGFLQSTADAIDGRTMHLYHIEGAGGGHAPDIMEMVAEPNIVPSSTNPTNPFTVNTYDEHLEMIMVVHHLNPEVPEDVAFAESRIRNETIAAEDVLHDTGVISMFGTDSQGMGRQGELICRTWQVADSMKRQRGPLPEDEDTGADNYRIKRYMAKYTINPAITAGIEPYVGSIESGKLADLCIWEPEFFGIKPHTVFKSGFPVTSNQGEGNGSLITAQPRKQREVYGACGQAKHELSVQFASQAAVDNDIGSEYGLSTPVLPVKNTRNLTKEHMLHNTTRPDNIDVDSETHEVRIDGELITCEPQEEIPMAQQYML